MNILVATNNPDKTREILEILKQRMLPFKNINVVTLKDVGLVSDPEEDGQTFLENARIKAYATRDAIINKRQDLEDYIIIADDSGLCVDALDGMPGVHSARYACGGEDNSEHATHAANNAKLIKELEGVDEKNRTAHFVTAAVMLVPLNQSKDFLFMSDCLENEFGNHFKIGESGYYEYWIEGKCTGHIGYEPIGDGGFGYDPLFYSDVKGGKITNAQLGPGEKSEISHRGKAIRALADILEKL